MDGGRELQVQAFRFPTTPTRVAQLEPKRHLIHLVPLFSPSPRILTLLPSALRSSSCSSLPRPSPNRPHQGTLPSKHPPRPLHLPSVLPSLVGGSRSGRRGSYNLRLGRCPDQLPDRPWVPENPRERRWRTRWGGKGGWVASGCAGYWQGHHSVSPTSTHPQTNLFPALLLLLSTLTDPPPTFASALLLFS
jgi:hypothetical protein